MQMHGIEEWMTRLDLSRRRVEQMLACGDLPPPIRLGRLRRWTDDQIDAYIRGRVEAMSPSRGRPRSSGTAV